MKNKTLIWIIAALFCLNITFAFTPYECKNSANIYDTFSDSSINYTLWKVNITGAGTIAEAANAILLHTSNAGHFINFTTNTSLENSRTEYGLIGENGCISLNLTWDSNVAGASCTIKMNETTIYTTPSTSSGVKFNISVNVWRDSSTIWYNWSTNGTGGTLSSFTADENQIYLIKFAMVGGTTGTNSNLNITNVWINQTGILFITANDESLNTNITQNLTIQKIENESTIINTRVFPILISTFDRTAQIHFSGSPYGDRTYNLNTPTSKITHLHAYLLNKSLSSVQLVTFTTRSTSEDLVENAQYTISKLIGSENVVLTTPISNFAGQVQEYLDTSISYNFLISKESYYNKTFALFPISYTYNVILRELLQTQFNDTKGDITYSIYPTTSVLSENSAQQFNLTTNSPSGYIINYGVYYGATKDNNTDTTGGTASISVDTTGLENQTINVNYFIQSQGGYIQINRSYLFYNGTYGGNQTFTGLMQEYKTKINIIYRILFSLFISLFLGAMFFSFAGSAGSSAIAVMTFNAFGVVDFIPILIPTIATILVVVGYLYVGGNEGT